ACDLFFVRYVVRVVVVVFFFQAEDGIRYRNVTGVQTCALPISIRLPCYDFTPIIRPTFGGWFHKMVTSPTSGVANSRGVTGGVYKARERIHRGILIRDY